MAFFGYFGNILATLGNKQHNEKKMNSFLLVAKRGKENIQGGSTKMESTRRFVHFGYLQYILFLDLVISNYSLGIVKLTRDKSVVLAGKNICSVNRTYSVN